MNFDWLNGALASEDVTKSSVLCRAAQLRLGHIATLVKSRDDFSTKRRLTHIT